MCLYSFCLLFPGHYSYFSNYFQMLLAANMFRWPPNVTREEIYFFKHITHRGPNTGPLADRASTLATPRPVTRIVHYVTYRNNNVKNISASLDMPVKPPDPPCRRQPDHIHMERLMLYLP